MPTKDFELTVPDLYLYWEKNLYDSRYVFCALYKNLWQMFMRDVFIDKKGTYAWVIDDLHEKFWNWNAITTIKILFASIQMPSYKSRC